MHRILIVSPVRNEVAHIERVARAVAAQEERPDAWLVIDDGSTDGTRERLADLARELPFMSVLEAPDDRSLAGSRDRLAAAREIHNFNLALAQVDPATHTHVMKLDGDVELPPQYLRVLSERFREQPRLGLAGGVLVEPSGRGSGLRPITIPRYHVHGALKMYSRPCLTAIGGITERLAWDTIDETFARMRGFDTVTFPDLVCIHHRRLASADGQLRGHARHGECAYIVHYPAAWAAARALKVARRRPVGIAGGAFLLGYMRAAARGVERVPDADFRAFTRRELRGRLFTSPTRGPGASVAASRRQIEQLLQVSDQSVSSGGA